MMKSDSKHQDEELKQGRCEVLKFETECKEIIGLFYADETFDAFKRLQTLEKGIAQGQVEFIDTQNPQQALDDFKNKEEVKMLIKDFEILDEFLQEINGDMSNWKKFLDKETKKIYYRQEEGMKSHTIYLEAVYDAPLINLISILGEVQLFKQWVPITKESKIIGEVSHLRKMGYFLYNLPWPFYKREIYIQACGILLKEEKAAIVSMSSVRGDEWLGHKVDRDDKTVEVDVHKSLIYAKSLGKNKCQMKMIMNGDPHLDYIPQKLINWGMKNVLRVFLTLLGRKAKKLPVMYQELIEEKKEFYDLIRSKLMQIEIVGEEKGDAKEDDEEDEDALYKSFEDQNLGN